MMESDWSRIDPMTVGEIIATFAGVDTPMHVDLVSELTPVFESVRRTGNVANCRSSVDEETADLLDFLVLLNESSLGDVEARRMQCQTPGEVLHQIMVATADVAEAALASRPVRAKVAVGTGGTGCRADVSDAETGAAQRNARGRAVRATPAGSFPPHMVPHPREDLFSVLIVESQPLLREAVADHLCRLGAGTVHEAASVAEARARALATGPCDLAILDLGLPDGTGIDLVTELRAQGWPRIVVLASSDDPYAVRSAFQAGAQAYLLKSASPMVVTDGVRRVLEDHPSVAPLIAMGTRVLATDNTPRELAAREVEVLQLVADGQSNKEIGEALNLSALTVKSHLSRIGRKLGTGDRAQMVALAMRAGVIR